MSRGKPTDKRVRAKAVSLALVTGAAEASRQTGIPERSIRVWMDNPEFAELRTKTREELSEGFKALAHLSMTRLLEQVRAGLVEPRDLTILLGVATDKHLLLTGEATTRTESKDITHDLDDHEAEVFGEVVRAELARRADKHLAESAVESATQAGAEATAG